MVSATIPQQTGSPEDGPRGGWLHSLVDGRRSDRVGLHESSLNRQLPRMLGAIGFDREYVRATGCELYDAEGRRYLDLLAGFGVHALGRNHPFVRQALHEVLDAQLADLVQIDAPLLPGLLAEKLLAAAPGLDRVFFCNSGSEAVEAAAKFARRATGRPRVLHLDHAYHGLTAGALSLNGSAEFRDGFGPLLPGGVLPIGDLDALARELARGDVAALVAEPIQGKGVFVAPPGYLRRAADLLHAHGALLICDEVQTGVGRTGKFFAYQHDGVTPDIVTVAKALSGGFVPIGATLATDAVFEAVFSSVDRVFVHASTFAGNALAMAAALATLQVVERQDLVGAAQRTGAGFAAALAQVAQRHPLLVDVRGRGLMIGLEFGPPSRTRDRASWYALRAARKGLFTQTVVGALFHRHRMLTQVAGDHLDVIKLIPPLVITEAECAEFVAALDAVLTDAGRGGGLMREFGGHLIKQAIRR